MIWSHYQCRCIGYDACKAGLIIRVVQMETLQGRILEQLVEGSSEPIIVAQVDRPDWPVVLCNPAFEAITGDISALERPFADVVEQLIGRDLALEISELVRSGQETSIPVELSNREYLLVLRSMPADDGAKSVFYAAYWRDAASAAGAAAEGAMHPALLNAKRQIRDLSREDPITGLLNETAFRDVLAHDWAVAAREKSTLALVSLSLDDFNAYFDVFGRHATDSCMRRVAQAIRRCLRRASDVAARIDDDKLIVLSHATDDTEIHDFAAKIAMSVTDLGLHHPRSNVSRFVTVSYRVCLMQASRGAKKADQFLSKALAA